MQPAGDDRDAKAERKGEIREKLAGGGMVGIEIPVEENDAPGRTVVMAYATHNRLNPVQADSSLV